MRVIINADDLGISEVVNNSVFSLMSKGRVTSATLMANGPAISQALSEIGNFPKQSFGVHLNITEFRPLLRTSGLALLLDSNGELTTNVETISITPSLMYAIAQEFSRQIEFLLSKGVALSHIDSHRHVHTIPCIFPVIKYVQRKFGIRRVRLTRTIPQHAPSYRGMTLLKKTAYNFFLRHVINTRTTDGFADLHTFYEISKKQNITGSAFELMVHPGTDTADDVLLLQRWEDELPYSVSFINYHQL